MRRFLGALALLLMTTTAAVAQNSVGLKGGINLANLVGDDSGDAKTLTGIVGGGFATIRLGEILSFQPEVLYVQKGAKQQFDGVDMKFKLSYVEIPVLVRVAPTPDAKLAPHFILGPTIAFKTSCKIQGEDSSVSVDVDCDNGEFEMPLKSTNFGMLAGAGADIRMGRAFLTFDARYSRGLSTIVDATNPDDVKNESIAIMAGFRVPVGGGSGWAAR